MNDSLSLTLAVCFIGVCCFSGRISASDSKNYINTGKIKAINFGKQISNAALNVSIQKTVFVASEFHCQMECVMHGPCLSYNFGTTPGAGNGFSCQLCAADRFSEIQRFNDDTVEYVHRGIMSECEKQSPCADDQICVPDYNNNKARCMPLWMPLTGILKQIDSGPYGAVWSATIDDKPYKWKEDAQIWEYSTGGMKHVSSGEGGVWGASPVNQIFYREGSMGNNLGSSWKLVNGLLKQIDSGPYGVVYGTNSRDEVYYRAGITDSDPKGTSWTLIQLQGHVNYISCGIYNCWGVNGVSKVFVRTEVSRQTPAGSGWIELPETMKQIECGFNGEVWGVNTTNEVFYRANITAATPIGTDWVRVQGSMAHVTVGCDGVYGLDSRNKFFRYMGKNFKRNSCS